MKHKKRSPAFPLEVNPVDYCVIDGKTKRKYPSQLDAELQAPVRELQQYVCEVCGMWHNGGSQEIETTIPRRRLQ